jgi:DNA-binding response OmpR family regulator
MKMAIYKRPGGCFMPRVLLVEDEVLIAMMLEDKLRELGFCVAGVSATVASALGMLRSTDPDVAIVEFKLADEVCDVLLRELRLRRIPVVLVTAARIDRTDPQFANVNVLEKPVDMAQLADILDQLQGGTARARDPRVALSQPHEAHDLVEG